MLFFIKVRQPVNVSSFLQLRGNGVFLHPWEDPTNLRMFDVHTLEEDKRRVKEFMKEIEQKLKLSNVEKSENTVDAESVVIIDCLHIYYANRIGFVDDYDAKTRKSAVESTVKKETTGKTGNTNVINDGVLHNLHSNTYFSFKDYFSNYLAFTRIIDLSECYFSIKKFELDVFLVVLGHDYIDHQIVTFLGKVLDDPVDYPKEEKKQFYYVLLLCYFYTRKVTNKGSGTDMMRLRDKLYQKTKKMSYLLDTKALKKYYYDIEPVNDPHLDKIIIKLFVNKDKNERTAGFDSKLLNFYYTMYLRKDRIDFEVFYCFQKNLNSAIKALPHNKHVGYLKSVFLKDTVLYNLTDVRQIIRFVFLFYTNKLTHKILKKVLNLVFDFFHILSANHRLIDAILEEMTVFLDNEKFRDLQDDRMKMIVNQHSIRSSRCFGDFSTFLIFNSDSFHSMKLLIDHFISTYKYFDVNYVRFVAIIDFFDLLINKIKTEFLHQVYVVLVDCLANIIYGLNAFLNAKICADDTDISDIMLSLTLHDIEKLRKFVNKFVRTYFKLFTGNPMREKKKKTKGCIREDLKDKKMLNMLSAIRDNEIIANSYLKRCNISRTYFLLKDRGLCF